MEMRSRRPAVLALLLVLAAACDSSAAERVEAQRVIAAYESLTAAVGQSGREAQLRKLEAMPLRREAPQKARNLCVEAHGALLEAEQSQHNASRMLEKAIEGKGSEPLAPDEISSIQATIDQSETSLKSARERFEQCEHAVRDLAIRFGQKR